MTFRRPAKVGLATPSETGDNQDVMANEGTCRKATAVRFDPALKNSGEHIHRTMSLHERVIAEAGIQVLHTGFSTPRHPHRFALRMDLLANGLDPKVVTPISYSVGNTEKGRPEWLVVNSGPCNAEYLIEMCNQVWDSHGDRALRDGFVMLEEWMVYLKRVEATDLTMFGEATLDLFAIELRLSQQQLTPEWIQIVYSDRNERFPWDSDYGASQFQPVAGAVCQQSFNRGSLRH